MVSILMNCYNGEKYLQETLQSVFSQTYQDWEIIFIDNCSTDNTSKIVQSFEDKRIKYFKTPHRMSLCQARVWAKDFINGKYFSVLDSDDIILPNKLEKQVEIFEQNPNVGLVYSNSIFFTDEGKTHLCYSTKMPSGNIFPQILEGYFLSLETLMVRYDIMKKHNLFFSPTYNVCSDMELFTKLSYYTQAYYIDEPLAKWRYGYGSTTEKHFESFPKEHEILLNELTEIIPNFNQVFAIELKKRRANVANMYGIAFWQKGERIKTLEKFFEASKNNPKYWINYVLALIFPYQVYKNIKNRIGKI